MITILGTKITIFMLALWALMACTSPTAPPDPTCTYIGVDGLSYPCEADSVRVGGFVTEAK